MKQEALAALAATHESWSTCLAQLPACDLEVLAALRVEPQLSKNRERASELNAAGYSARNIESLTYRTDDVTVNDSLDVVVVTECSTDGVVLYLPNPDGNGEQIVNDNWSSAREAWTMVRGDDGVWRAQDNATVTPPVAGVENNLCA